MPVGTKLSVLRQMLYSEVGDEMDETISPSLIPSYNQKLNNQQAFLFAQHSYLRGKTVVNLQANIGQQYYSLPSGIDFDHLEQPTYTNVSNFRYRIANGITQEDYNLFRSDLGVMASPVMKWQLINIIIATVETLQIELWPIPSVSQTIIYTGILPLTTMVADTDTCVIDDLALVLYTAAEILARKGAGDAQAKGAKAKAHMDAIRAAFPSQFEVWNISGQEPRFDGFRYNNYRRPVVAVNGSATP